MEIGVFGATGVIGSRVVEEARRRGHAVRAFAGDAARIPAGSEGVDWRVADWRDADSVADAIAGLDVVVSAVNAGHGIEDTIAKAGDFVVGARAMVRAMTRHPEIRVIAVGGGGSLEVAPGLQLVDQPGFAEGLPDNLGVPVEYHRVILALREALNVYRLSDRQWTYLSPSSGRIDPGTRTGRYRVGGDQLLDAEADISAEDLAVALLDEAEAARFVQRRFTVAAA
ncbi:NAD(P)-dependent oxidoreductase [Nocardia cyriacigeorgica]|uniref:NAD-dependent epimerase/dehydratase family protein n=1 Tax=Nocardia cyriacigeorgica TaxID=135487 RepID=A0A5R8NY17_9NOCA|nr:NAD(P)H-binding protein [Nocardia cyriacigeorgica]TLF81214.1 NAD-dependent epimerase/dehydratase family protein [Nocardia cyriacigeorgica]